MVSIFVIIIAVAAVFFLTVMAIDCHRFVVKEYTCSSRKLHQEGKIVLLSDLHNKSFGKDNRKLMEAIHRQNPDMIVIAGDMYTSAPKEDNGKTADFVCRLAEKYPVYYGNGNHEHKTKLYTDVFGDLYSNYANRLKEAGVVMLENERVTLPSYNMEILGSEIGREYYGKLKTKKMPVSYMDDLLGKAPKDEFALLIAHNPDYFETYAAWGADLTVSGHVHGGLMVLPFLGGVISPSLRLFPKYDGGEFREGKHTMILGRGLGTHTLPIRIFNPGELVVIYLKPEKGTFDRKLCQRGKNAVENADKNKEGRNEGRLTEKT